MARRWTIVGVALALLATAGLTGCAQLTVKRYPDFWEPGQLETVEVVNGQSAVFRQGEVAAGQFDDVRSTVDAIDSTGGQMTVQKTNE